MLSALLAENNYSTKSNWLLETKTDEQKFQKIQKQLRGFDLAMVEVGYRFNSFYFAIKDKNYDLAYMFPSKLRSRNVWNADFDGWADIPLVNDLECVKSSSDMIELLHESSATKITSKYLKDWYARMRRLSTYKQYSKYIDTLYEILKNKTSDFHNFNKKLQANWLEGNQFLN